MIQENWGYLCAHMAEERLEAEVEDAVDQLFPTRFFSSDSDPCRIDARRNFDWLWDQAERLKIALLGDVGEARGRIDSPLTPCRVGNLRSGANHGAPLR